MNIKLLVSGIIIFIVALSTVILYYENRLIPLEKYQTDNIELKKELLSHIKNQNIPTADSLIYSDRFGHVWKKEKITNNIRFGIYLDNNQCHTCVVSALEYFNSNIKNLKIDMPFILTDSRYMSIRELKIMENENRHPVFPIDVNQYPALKSITDSQKPFYFLIDATNTISAIYIAKDTLNSIIGKEYFGLIKEKTERNNQ